MTLQRMSKRLLQTQMGRHLLLISKKENGETNGLYFIHRHMWKYLLGDDKIKCMCCEDARKINVFTDDRSQSMKMSSLQKYKMKMQMWKGQWMTKFLKSRIENTRAWRVLCMKLVHFYACNDIPLEKYAKQCNLQRELALYRSFHF